MVKLMFACHQGTSNLNVPGVNSSFIIFRSSFLMTMQRYGTGKAKSIRFTSVDKPFINQLF